MGININVIYRTKIILFSIQRTYSPNVIFALLEIKLTDITIHMQVLMRCLWLCFYKLHRLRTTYHSKTEWVPYQMKIINLSTGWILSIQQYWSQQSYWASNRPHAHRYHPVCKIMTVLRCYIFMCCRKLKHEKPIICNKKESVIWIQS